jgi:16S rRNA pseudouridine516 synthase
VRLDVLLARNAGWSRTVARSVIAEGRVQIAGTLEEDPRREIAPAELPFSVVVDDEELPLHDRVTLALNKPLGCVTALRDPRHPTAYELLTEAPLFGELRPVGRLDLETSGLLIWSTDGTEIQRLTHPKRAVPRTYQAALAGPFAPLPDKLILDDGHEPKISGFGPLSRDAAHPSLNVPAETCVLATITIVGGAYHEVRRIFAALGSHVLGLCRVSFGDVELPRDLAPGEYHLLPRGASPH